VTETAHPAPARHRASLAALWFGLFGAPAAWSVQMLADYSTNAHGCYPRLYPLPSPTMGAARMTLVLSLVSAAAVLIGIAALVVALRSYMATRPEWRGVAHELLEVGEGRTRFMALSGVMLSALFLLASLVHAASVLLLAECSY
jgi:hypothetical protein